MVLLSGILIHHVSVEMGPPTKLNPPIAFICFWTILGRFALESYDCGYMRFRSLGFGIWWWQSVAETRLFGMFERVDLWESWITGFRISNVFFLFLKICTLLCLLLRRYPCLGIGDSSQKSHRGTLVYCFPPTVSYFYHIAEEKKSAIVVPQFYGGEKVQTWCKWFRINNPMMFKIIMFLIYA